MWELISSVLTGGATGLIGAGITSFIEYKKQKQKDAHELALMKEERQTLELEIQGRERVVVIQTESEKDIAETKAFAESLSNDKAAYSSGDSKYLVFVDVVRGLTRPSLTAYLVLLVTILWFTTDNEQVEEKIAATVLYLTTAAVLWWFGSRAKQPK